MIKALLIVMVLCGIAEAGTHVMQGDAAGGSLSGTYPNPTLSIPGSTNQCLFNDGGSFGADSNFIWDNANKVLVVGGGSTNANSWITVGNQTGFVPGQAGDIYVNDYGNVFSAFTSGMHDMSFEMKNSSADVTFTNPSTGGFNVTAQAPIGNGNQPAIVFTTISGITGKSGFTLQTSSMNVGDVTNGVTLNVTAGKTSAYEFTTSTTTTFNHVAISTSGHVITSGPSPTISSCGAAPSGSVVGDDNEGTITIGGGSVTSCTLTFASTWGVTPTCVITDNSVTIPGDISSISSTAFTISFNLGLGGGLVYYSCGCSGSTCR